MQPMTPFELRELVDSTMFDYSKIHGEKYIRDHIQHIYLGILFMAIGIGNSFREIGFGFMSLEIKEPD